MPPIVIATGNPHKVEEMRAMFAGAAIEVLGLADLPGPFAEPTETGATFEENSAIKALAYAQATGMMCLADDSGLEIDALSGRPGVISSHYCTDGRETGMTRAERDAANNARVLRELEGTPPDRRTARFVCAMTLARRGTIIARTRGTMEGRIGLPGEVPRGSHGFGYDPLFLLPAPDPRTSAELDPQEKNARSHRGMAARLMAARIAQLVEKRD